MAYGGSIGAWGVHQLDGVTMKIGDRFIPPKKITLPISFQAKSPSDIFFSEYDFTLENCVIDHANAQKRAREAAAIARLEAENAVSSDVAGNNEDTIDTRDEAQSEVTTNEIKLPDELTATETNSSSLLPETASSLSTVSKNDDSVISSNPFITNPALGGASNVRQASVPFFGQDILTPVPIKSTPSLASQNGGQNNGGKADFDLADFEREQDPFDKMEMKILNDMVELNKVLMGAQATSSANTNQSNSVNQFSAATQPADATVDYPKSESNVEQVPPSDVRARTSNIQISANSVSYRAELETGSPFNPFSSSSAGNVDQNKLQSDVNTLPHQPPTSTNPFSSNFQLPPVSNTSFLVHQQREPMYSKHHSNTILSSLSSFVQSNPPSAVNNSVKSSTFNTKPAVNVYSRYSPVQYPPNGLVSGGGVLGSTGSNSPGSRSRGSTPPPQPLRSSRSTPDVTLDDDRERPQFPVSHSPPPYVHRRSPSPRATSAQSWNSGIQIPVSQQPPSYSYVNNSTATKVNAVPKPALKDPYQELTWEGKQLVDTITSMGFPRSRTARAVQKIGQDDKQVVDHLCLINKLMEKGFSEEEAEMALHAHENNEEKALEFLKLMAQFLQLGFQEVHIKEALLRSNNDEEKTLDILTAT